MRPDRCNPKALERLRSLSLSRRPSIRCTMSETPMGTLYSVSPGSQDQQGTAPPSPPKATPDLNMNPTSPRQAPSAHVFHDDLHAQPHHAYPYPKAPPLVAGRAERESQVRGGEAHCHLTCRARRTGACRTCWSSYMPVGGVPGHTKQASPCPWSRTT